MSIPRGEQSRSGMWGWRRLLDRHDRAARAEVECFRGRFVRTTGDGILTTFDTPTRAIRCAFDLLERLADSGLGIRAAIHTGEIEVLHEEIGGIGVHIAARVLDKAGDHQVLVTRPYGISPPAPTSCSAPSVRAACEGCPAIGSCSKPRRDRSPRLLGRRRP